MYCSKKVYDIITYFRPDLAVQCGLADFVEAMESVQVTRLS
jgi:hypothetical protein